MDRQIVLLFLTLIFQLASLAILDGELDLFKATGILEEPPRGVWRKSSYPLQYQFGEVKDDLMVNDYTARYVANEINEGSIFTITSVVGLDVTGSEATILSANDKNGERIYFKLSLMRRRNKLRISFSCLTTGLKTTTVKAVVSDNNSPQKIAVKVYPKEKEVAFYVDDKKVERADLANELHVIPTDKVEVRLAQQYQKVGGLNTPQIGHLFKGVLQDTKIIFNSKQKPGQPDKCVCDDGKGGPLKNGCVMDGVRYKENTTWTKDECNMCSCKNGQITCVHHCPVCKVDGKMYLHGDIWDNKEVKCTRCTCVSGNIKCGLPITCPKPNCEGKSGRTITLEGQCCPICIEDQCIGTGKEFRCDCPKTCFNHKDFKCSKQTCKEGCYCPKMIISRLQRLEDDRGVCVHRRDCPCMFKNKLYQPGDGWQDEQKCLVYRCQNGDMDLIMNGCEK